ncbi:MAG: hypothetical protein MRY63_03065 [Neomegalonema sp.]|nr:hypothetical protein [Neomegalonema sp.]
MAALDEAMAEECGEGGRGPTQADILIDLGDEAWQAVEIDATGWRVIDEPLVRFRVSSQ